MPKRNYVLRWVLGILASICVVLSSLMVGFSPGERIGWRSDSQTIQETGRPAEGFDLPDPDRMHSASMEMRAPEPTNAQRFATYDNIVVEVKRDGTLRVLGERMEMDAFRSLIGEQKAEHLATVVTIRPDEDCRYHHIGPLIAVCEDFGIPHQMVASPPRTAAEVAPLEPAARS